MEWETVNVSKLPNGDLFYVLPDTVSGRSFPEDLLGVVLRFEMNIFGHIYMLLVRSVLLVRGDSGANVTWVGGVVGGEGG